MAALPSAPPQAEHRQRLLDAMSLVVARKGYAETTIADIAAEARVSKRTFYEHFGNKAECLIALYLAASDQALASLRAAIDPARDWHEQVEDAVQAYLSTLACNPPLVRTLVLEILHLGAEGLKVRRRVNHDIARFIVDVVRPRLPARARPPALLETMAVALVGGIDELIVQAIEDDRVEHLAELTKPAAHFVRAVIDGTLGHCG